MEQKEKIVYLPLDERPCNYKFPLRLAEMTELEVKAPPYSILGVKKQPADTDGISSWLERETIGATRLIVSLDMLVYGGIVPSRLHHLQREQCAHRLHTLRQLKEVNPGLTIYAFNLIMRVPAYNGDDEEPEYYARHGRQLFEYGWLQDKAERESLTQEESAAFLELRQTIPVEVLSDFISRRAVNAYVNRLAVELAAEGVIDRLIIPLDDNSKYGFSAKEQRELLFAVEEQNLMDRVLIYPGADEIGCTLLAKVFCDAKQYVPEAFVRFSSTQGPYIIPRYEDRSLNESIKSHLTAAGAFMTDASADADFVLMVHSPPVGQSDAAESNHPYASRHRAYYSEVHLNEFVHAIRTYGRKNKFVALADVATSNGADQTLMKLLSKNGGLLNLSAYAGWNTSGNTLGTVIAHAVIASYYYRDPDQVNPHWEQKSKQFLLQRLVEDWGYQTLVRSHISDKTLPELGLVTTQLGKEEEHICHLIDDQLNEFRASYLQDLSADTWVVGDVLLPWHRMFEVDFELQLLPQQTAKSMMQL